MSRKMLLGTLLLGLAAALVTSWRSISRPNVVSTSNSGIIITGNVAENGRVEVAAYDAGEERRRRTRTFAGSAYRLCQQYLSDVSNLQRNGSAASIPNFMFDGLSFNPELPEAMGAANYQKVTSEERQLQRIAGDLMQVQRQYAVAQAFAHAASPGQRPEGAEQIAGQFQSLRGELVSLTRAHCGFLSELEH